MDRANQELRLLIVIKIIGFANLGALFPVFLLFGKGTTWMDSVPILVCMLLGVAGSFIYAMGHWLFKRTPHAVIRRHFSPYLMTFAISMGVWSLLAYAYIIDILG